MIFHVSTRDEVAGNGYFGLAIGLAYTAALIATGEISGCALNPAIGLLAFINGDWNGAKQAYIYIFGPPIGAAIAGVVFKLTTLVDAAEESGPVRANVSQGTYVTFHGRSSGHLLRLFGLCVYVPRNPSFAPGRGLRLRGDDLRRGPGVGRVLQSRRGAGRGLPELRHGPGADLQALDAAIVHCRPSFVAVWPSPFTATQAGGTAAAILVGDHKVGHPSVGSGSDMGSAFLGEMVGTCLVVLVVLGTATVESTRDNMYFALAIGFRDPRRGGRRRRRVGRLLQPRRRPARLCVGLESCRRGSTGRHHPSARSSASRSSGLSTTTTSPPSETVMLSKTCTVCGRGVISVGVTVNG